VPLHGAAVKVEGAKELARAFRNAGNDAKQLSAAYRTIARQLAPVARQEAPVGPTGRLSASVRGLARQTGAQLAVGSARIRYAGPVHFGNPSPKTYPATRGRGLRSTGTLGVIAPNPFLYEAVDKRRDDIVRAFDDNVVSLLRDHGLM
jgi:hypothetical protein